MIAIRSFLLLVCLSLSAYHLDTFYGSMEVTDKTVIDIIEHPVMQRLKKVRQYGTRYYTIKADEYDRFQHSIGVYYILNKFGASKNEQLAGLLHDASHTVFSHVGDWIFDHPDGKSSFQDDIHEFFLQQYGMQTLLQQHGLTIADIHHKNDAYCMLDQELPDMCADRIEYNIQGGVIEGLITHQQAQEILMALRFENGIWFFVDVAVAKTFANISLYLTEHSWGEPLGVVGYKLTAQAIKRALHLEYLVLDQIYFGTDDIIWQLLQQADDEQIKAAMYELNNIKKCYCLTAPQEADFMINPKFRGINPLVCVDNQLIRLTELDADFAHMYETAKKVIERGWAIKRTNIH